MHSFATAGVVNSLFVSQKYGFNRGFDCFYFVPESHAPMGAAPINVVPTTLSLLGISGPSTFVGLDLCPFWQESCYKLPDRFIFSEADQYNAKNDIKRAVWHGKYKLHYDLLTKKVELYSLANDPTERLNIVSEKPSVVELLFTELKKFMMTGTGDKQSVPLAPEEIEKLKSLGYL